MNPSKGRAKQKQKENRAHRNSLRKKEKRLEAGLKGGN